MKNLFKGLLGRIYRVRLSVIKQREQMRIILMYHRVTPDLPSKMNDSAMYVTAATFEMHIKELATLFDIVPLKDCVFSATQGKNLCAITFDDGWNDNYEHAFPIIKKYGIPVTIFIPVSMITNRRNFWFDDVLAFARLMHQRGKSSDFISFFGSRVTLWQRRGMGEDQLCDLIEEMKKLGSKKLDALMTEASDLFSIDPNHSSNLLSWDQIHEMNKHGVTFGSHGLHHRILTNLMLQGKQEEIYGSHCQLAMEYPDSQFFFSYPNGDYDQESCALVSSAGYLGAVTTKIGMIKINDDACQLNRIGLHEHISSTPALLWFRIMQASAQ